MKKLPITILLSVLLTIGLLVFIISCNNYATAKSTVDLSAVDSSSTLSIETKSTVPNVIIIESEPKTVTKYIEIEKIPDDYEYFKSRSEQLRILEDKEIQNLLTLQEQYPVLMYVVESLRAHDISDYVIAGIIGNSMTECGYNTFTLHPEVYGYHKGVQYYGLWQWSELYNPDIQGADIVDQINYLLETMERSFSVYGNEYYKGFNYEKFLELKDVEEVALSFAMCYERCSSATYSTRKVNALRAYELIK